MIKEIVDFFARKSQSSFKEEISNIAVAVWSIRQMVVCPFCDHKFDIIASNLKRKTNQGRMIAKGIEVQELGNNRSECKTVDTIYEIPTPPYFGALMEDTEGIDEHIPCNKCGKDINVQECHWQYGE